MKGNFFLKTSILNCSPQSFHHFCTSTPPPQYSSSYLGESQKRVRPQKHLDFHVVFMFGSIVIYHRVV